MKVIAGTGHRPGKRYNYSNDDFQKLIDLCEVAIETYNPDIIISGMALGFDQALAEAAIKQNIPYIAAVPCYGYSSKWNILFQENFERLLDHATESLAIYRGEYTKDCLQKRNEWMVDRADEIIALWDKQPAGGTYNCICYAKKHNKPIHNLWDIWIEL